MLPTHQQSATSFGRLDMMASSNALEEKNSVPLLSMLRSMQANSSGAGASGNYWAGRETELRQKIHALEEIVAEYERQKFSVLGTFTDFRERVAERERRLEAEYSSRIIDLSEEVLGAKREFEERMKSFQLLQEQFEREKEQALEKLRQDHQREMQALEQRYIPINKQRHSESQLLSLEQKYMLQIQRLEEERKTLRAEKERLGENFEVKLRHAESLFESELTAAKMLYNRELQALKVHEEALKNELTARQEEFQERLAELQHQSRKSNDELCFCRSEMLQLEERLRDKATEIQRLAKELTIARQQTEAAVRRLSELIAETEEHRQRLAAHQCELEQKVAQLTEAEADRARLEQTVRELRMEVQALRNRVELMEVERDGLQAQTQSQTKLHDSQLTALEAMLESVTRDKDGCVQQYEEMLQNERLLSERRENELRREFSAKLGELEEQYNGLREHVEQHEREQLDTGAEEEDNSEGASAGQYGTTRNEKLWQEIESLRAEKKELEEELLDERSARSGEFMQIANAIKSVGKKLTADKQQEEDEEEAVEEGNEEFDNVEQQQQPAVQLAELLKWLREMERSVQGIVREKEQAKARVEQLHQELEEEKAQNDGRQQKPRKDDDDEAVDEMEMKNAELREAREMVKQKELELSELREALAHQRDKDVLEQYAREKQPVDQLEKELLDAEDQLEQIREAAERELRQLEEQHAHAMEQKIDALNREHERTVELMQQREQEMAEKLEQLRNNNSSSCDVNAESRLARRMEEDGTQTDDGNVEAREQTIRQVANELEQFKSMDKERDQLIQRLQAELAELYQQKEIGGTTKGKKEIRSQSIASASEHFVLCQKMATAAASNRLVLEDFVGCNNSSEGGSQRKECQKHHQHEQPVASWRAGGGAGGLLERRGVGAVGGSTTARMMDATVPQDLSPPGSNSSHSGSATSSQKQQIFFASMASNSKCGGTGTGGGAATPGSTNVNNNSNNPSSSAAVMSADKRPAWKF